MAYDDGLAVLRIYTTKDLSEPTATTDEVVLRVYTGARDVYADGYVVDAPAVAFPTLVSGGNIILYPHSPSSPYAYIRADVGTTRAEFEAAGFNVSVDENGWYLELPFEPVDESGVFVLVDPYDPSNFSPVYVRMEGSGLTKVWVCGTFSGGVYELGQRGIATYSEEDFIPIELSPADLPNPCPAFWRGFNNTVEVDLCPEPLPYFKSSMLGTYAPLPIPIPTPIFDSGIEVVTGEWIDGALVSSSAPISGLPAPFMRSTGGTLSFEFSETYSVPYPIQYNYISGYYAALITGPGGSDPNQTVLVDAYFDGYQPIDQTVLLGVPDVMPPTFIGSPESSPQYLRGMVITLVAREPGYEFVIGEIYTFTPK